MISRAARNTLATATVFLSACAVVRAGETNSIESNLRYRLAWGDLGSEGEIVPAQPESKRALRVAEGGARLLQICRDNPDLWQQDPLLFRFGHRHPFSTIGCRERTSPGLHVVFYLRPDGTRAAWVHFDLHGPQETLGHLGEVVRKGMTFGRTSEDDVYRGLVRKNPNGEEPVPEPRYDLAAHARRYLHDAFGPSAFAAAGASAAVCSTIPGATGWGLGSSRYPDRIATILARNAVAQSIEFGAAAFLEQEERFLPSHDHGFWRRTRLALYRSLFVPGRDGDELAFPRVAAALGTPWVMRPLHPGLKAAPDPWAQSGLLLGRYVVRSFWVEFRPEIQNAIHKVFRRESPGMNPRVLFHSGSPESDRPGLPVALESGRPDTQPR